MSYEIEYRSKWSGKKEVHRYSGTRSGAEGWARSLAEEHGCRAVCTNIADGPYDHSGKRTHILSVGDDG